MVSGDRDRQLRSAGMNVDGRKRASSLCGIVIFAIGLCQELSGLSGECKGEAVVSYLVFFAPFFVFFEERRIK